MAARTRNRLTGNIVKHVKSDTRARLADGGGLYLSISPNGGRRWVFLYRWQGKPTEIGLGSARDVTLARARELATECRSLLAERRDPRAARRISAGETFGEFADRFVDEKVAPGLRNAKHIDQWKMTLTVYAAPLRPLLIAQVTTEDVLACLKPIWTEKPETASRLRGRIEAVLDAARAKGLRTGENPARWRGHLDHLLPKRQRLSRGHHAAMPFADVPEFMVALREVAGLSARALELTILTAARSGEVLGARWEEIDVEHAVWTVPASRMKAGVEHRVPLSPRALEIVQGLREAGGVFLFPGERRGRPLSNMSLAMVLRRMKLGQYTVHGFRSSFRDWAGERTNYPNEVCEAALAHTIRSKVEAAYRRGDALEKRRALMDAWAVYCEAVNR